jgi:phytoene synthase
LSDDPATVLAHPGLPAACAEIAVLARQHFTEAERAMADCKRAAMRPAMMMGGVYRALLDRLERRGWAAPRHEVKVPKLLKIWIALRRGYL